MTFPNAHLYPKASEEMNKSANSYASQEATAAQDIGDKKPKSEKQDPRANPYYYRCGGPTSWS